MYRILAKVNALSGEMERLSDADLQAVTGKLRGELRNGAALDSLLPRAFAAMREASKRVLGKFPYDVQVLGGIALHQGKIAEMKTGEGKTLVATMPLYLNALTGKGCILVTTNSYLAARDGEELKPLYRFMGMTEAVGVSPEEGGQLTNAQKKRVYASDIVYTTNDALAFDYLFENLESSAESRYLRGMNYVIVDEADSVLLDSAQIPLIVSGMPRVQSNLFGIADYFVTTLEKDRDYKTEDKNVWLTQPGIRKAERFFSVKRHELYTPEHEAIIRHINLALRAHVILKKEERYIVRDRSVCLLDEKTGRVQPSTKLRCGQHQALEAKEHVTITEESRAVAAVTYQSYFNMYRKFAGMTGTGAHDADEFRQIYGLDTVIVPTRKKVQRVDYPDLVYPNQSAQMHAALREVLHVHESGQPVLVIASSIQMSDLFSEMLLDQGIPHNVLNAYNIPKEAAIIQEAGQKDAVTVATAVAGRGTDIRLGDGVPEMGGLAVIGIGLMVNKRQELQGRGRSGRQGDPGFSRFYLSLDDEVVLEYGKKWLNSHRKGTKAIRNRRILRAVHNAQRIASDMARASRKATRDFGESMEKQRNLIYETRNRVMNQVPLESSYYLEMERLVVEHYLDHLGHLPDPDDAVRFVMDNISYEFGGFTSEEMLNTRKKAVDYLMQQAEEALERKSAELGSRDILEKYYRLMTLHAIDQAWVEQVDYLQQLRQVISGRQYARHNAKFVFPQEAYKGFEKMQMEIRAGIMRNILLGEPVWEKDGKLRILYP